MIAIDRRRQNAYEEQVQDQTADSRNYNRLNLRTEGEAEKRTILRFLWRCSGNSAGFGTFQDFVNVGGGALSQVNETDALGHVGGAAGENNVDLKIRRNNCHQSRIFNDWSG